MTSEIPEYLKQGEHYKVLSDDFLTFDKEKIENGIFICTPKYYIKDDTVKSFEDFIQILDLYEYWKLLSIPLSLYLYYYNTSNDQQKIISHLKTLSDNKGYIKDFCDDLEKYYTLVENKKYFLDKLTDE